MSAREAIINEIKLAPDALVQEAYDYLLFLKGRESQGHASGVQSSVRPDFLARQRALFGNRMLPDSQEIMDELR